MTKQIVFFDLDGTILNDDKTIEESAKKAIAILQKKGVITAIATGRTPSMFDGIREELNIDSYVSMNGQYVVLEGKELYANPIDIEMLERLAGITLAKGHALACCGHEEMKVNDENHPFIWSSFEMLKMDYPGVDLDFYRYTPVYQGHLYCTDNDVTAYEELFPDYEFIRWHPHAADILPKGASKAIGVQKMIEAAGVSIENSYAFGDGLNDIEMLTFAGTGIAMGNAVPDAKKAADFVTDSNVHDGILKGLIQAGLIKKIEVGHCQKNVCCARCAKKARKESLKAVHFI